MKEEKSTTILSTNNNLPPFVSGYELTVLQLPSKITCGICCVNITTYVMKRITEIDVMAGKERIPAYHELLEMMESIPNNMCVHLIVHVNNLLEIELRKLKISGENRLNRKNQPQEKKIEPNKEVKMVVFQGLKREFLALQAHIYFNPNNPKGFHMSKKQINPIATMLFETFKSEDGTMLTLRTIKLALKDGFNMNSEGVVTYR